MYTCVCVYVCVSERPQIDHLDLDGTGARLAGQARLIIAKRVTTRTPAPAAGTATDQTLGQPEAPPLPAMASTNAAVPATKSVSPVAATPWWFSTSY